MDRDNASTVIQEDSRMTRRGVMRATAVGVGAAGAVGGASEIGASPVGSAQAIAPLLLAGGGIAAGAAAGYLINEGADIYLGESNEEYDETNADAVTAQIIENALGLKQADEAVLTNIENLLASSKNYVIAEAKKAAIDALNADKSTQNAIDASQVVIDNFFATQQKNLVAHYEAQVSRVQSWIDRANNTDSLSSGDIFTYSGSTNAITGYNVETRTLTLLDGSDLTYDGARWQQSGGNGPWGTIDYLSTAVLQLKTDSGTTDFFNIPRFNTLYDNIKTAHSDVSGNMETLINELGTKYQTGDIKSGDIISPTDLAGDGASQSDFTQAGAQLASMGLQSSKFAMAIELVETGETVEGAIYHSDDSIDSLQKDVQYDPETDIQGTVYLAYNNTDKAKGELVGLEEPFIIREITDGDGNEYNAANYESKNQQTYNAEIEEVQKELDQVRELRESLEEQRDAAATNDGGGGGGFLSGGGSDIETLGIVAGGAALAAILFGNN